MRRWQSAVSSQHSEVKTRNPEPHAPSGVLLAAACLLLAAASAGEVKVVKDGGLAKLSVVRRVELDYHLLTRSQPVEFEVDGPCWLRVYTRLWWSDGADAKQSYALSLWQGEARRPLEFETGLSKSSLGPGQQKVGRWRSFFVQMPAGKNRYRLELDDAKSGKAGVRFSLEEPRPWESVSLGGLRELVLVQGSETAAFHLLPTGEAHQVRVAGPCRVRVSVRLNYDVSLVGAQSLVLSVDVDEKPAAEQNLRVTRSAVAVYANEPGLVPSVERNLRLSLGEGEHRLGIRLSGTMAKSVGVRVERLRAEKYE